MKKILITLVLAIFILSGCSKKKVEYSMVERLYSIDVENYKELVEDATHVFVAKVKENVETIYKNKTALNQNDKKEIKVEGTPYTNFKVEILENIKGNLKANSETIVQRYGGISENNKNLMIVDDLIFPQEGKNYIFIIYEQEDGTLIATSKNSSISLSEIDKYKDLKNKPLDLFEKYK